MIITHGMENISDINFLKKRCYAYNKLYMQFAQQFPILVLIVPVYRVIANFVMRWCEVVDYIIPII